MSLALASPSNCCSPCSDQVTTQIPGPPGDSAYQVAVDEGFVGTEAQWLASLDGDDGQNAFTDLALAFTVPDAATPDIAEVDNSDWAVVGQVVFLEGAGYFTVVSKPDSTHVELDNTDYPGNAADGTIIPVDSHLGPAGLKGTDGTNGTGDMTGSNNLSELTNTVTALGNLGGTTVGINIFKMASPSAIRFLRVNADNSVTLLSVGDFRTALALVPGTDVQVYDAFLTSIAALGTAADKIIYTTGVNVAAETAITSLARTLISRATAALMRSDLGKVLPRYGLLASKSAVDLNSAATDNAVTVESARYRIDKIVVDNASVNLTTATLGVFTAAGGGGTTVAADQALAALTASSKFLDLTLGGAVTADVVTAATLYVRVGTAQGVAATGNVWIFGWTLE